MHLCCGHMIMTFEEQFVTLTKTVNLKKRSLGLKKHFFEGSYTVHAVLYTKNAQFIPIKVTIKVFVCNKYKSWYTFTFSNGTDMS